MHFDEIPELSQINVEDLYYVDEDFTFEEFKKGINRFMKTKEES